MKYTKENLIGVKFITSTDTYEILGWSGTNFKLRNSTNPGFMSDSDFIIKNINSGIWPIQNLIYEIYQEKEKKEGICS